MLQYSPLIPRGIPLGRGAMVAQRTLDPFILVRIRAPQPERLRVVKCSESPTRYHNELIRRALHCRYRSGALAICLFRQNGLLLI